MKKKFTHVLAIGILCLMSGCANNRILNEDELVEITSGSADNLTDLVLSVVESKLNSDGVYEIIAAGKHEGKIAGFRVEIQSEVTGAEPEGLTLYSIGDESDNLVTSLGELYSHPTDKSFTDEDVTFDIWPLTDEEAILENGEHTFKLFYDPNDDAGLYSELFLKINLPAKRIVLSEKDEAYRGNIIEALTQD